MEKKEKTVLACFGERKREVTFSASDDGDDLQALLAAIKAVYHDVIKMDAELVVQLKNENWAGEFLDIKGSTIPDKAVIKVVNEVKFQSRVNNKG